MNKFIYTKDFMSTRVSVTVFSDRNQKEVNCSVQKGWLVFENLEKIFSLFDKDSEINFLNQQAGNVVKASPVVVEVLDYFLQKTEQTEGWLNPLLGSFTAPIEMVGNHQDRREKFLQQKNLYQEIKINKLINEVFLPNDSWLDLNSIVKGWAIDLALDCFEEQDSVLLEAGGDIKVKNLPPASKAWNIAIRDPFDIKNILLTLEIKKGAICTTGGYFRENIANSAGRYHLISPFGIKSSNEIVSLSIIAPTAKEADALSTALYFMSINKITEFIKNNSEISAVIVAGKNEVYCMGI